MKRYLQRILVFLTLFALLLSFTSCDSVSELNDFMNSIFGQENADDGGFSSPPASVAKGKLSIHFLDVGQGDSVFLSCDDANILIDTGDIDKESTQYIIDYLKALKVRRLDYLILTHPDADHIGGAPEIISEFKIGTVLMPDASKTTAIFNRTLDAIEESGAECIFGESGQLYTEGALQMRVLAPNSAKYSDSNDYSIAVRVLFGETAVLLTGDAEKISESEMIKKYAASEFKVDLMKAGHHGSNTSNSEALLRAADPEWIVVSCGKGNKYGHPHAEFLTRAESLGITVYRTDLEGTIVFVSDGKVIKKSDS